MALAAASPVDVLGDDLLQEVFVLLPGPADLLRTALACRPFLRAARSAAFLRRFRRRHPFTCPLLLGCHLGPPLLLPAPPIAATRRVAERGDFALSFIPRRGRPGAAGASTPWQLLDCRNGRLLLRSRSSQELVVADPLARRWVSLPALPGDHPVGYGLVADDGDYSVFQAACISRVGDTTELRAFLLSSAELRWADVGGLAQQPNLAASRAMQANQSLYWTLVGGQHMLALNTATTELVVLPLPPFLRELGFDVIEKGEDVAGGLHVLTMRGFCIEVWVGEDDGAGGLAWTLLDKSVRFHRAIAEMIGSEHFYHLTLDVIGVAAGVVFLRNGSCLFCIHLETMKMTKLSENESCPSALIYPYTIAWPPVFLNPTEEGA
ncbi:uncharacterized protein [Aegilops tauschii subsp. strangulata]|uniref:F-box protein AT5G49610-like beta-propeller domain-containing protein n=1 Tax=Aegilops tauschii subsp. strangulata TaxID=200361 RepID=A0A452XZE4_AEGTS|nr:uncharacterized protein LOC109770689 [Aegilops tauschii subsp. strangulata]